MPSSQESLVCLVLASGSPRRRQLLAEHGYVLEVVPANVEEWDEQDADPAALVRHNAELKGAHVAGLHPDRPVLAADTTVAHEGHVLNKPRDIEHAASMLRRLSGHTHSVFTAISLFWKNRDIAETRVTETRVTFRQLAPSDIERYFLVANPLDKAGAYGIQEGTDIIIEGFTGSYTNVMGLPMETLETLLEQLGVKGVLKRSETRTSL